MVHPLQRAAYLIWLQGSAEAVRDAVAALGDEEVRLEVVSTDVGPITIADVEMARDIGANILAFGVKPAVAAVETSAKNNGVRICQQRVIYHMLQDVSTSGLGTGMPQCR